MVAPPRREIFTIKETRSRDAADPADGPKASLLPQDCFRKVKISRVLEPFLATGGGVVVELGEGEGVGEGEGDEGCGVDVPP